MNRFADGESVWDMQYVRSARVIERESGEGTEWYIVRYPDGSTMSRPYWHLEKRHASD